MPYDILMFGWEFPPYNSGGLGVACKGIAKALADAGHNVTFVLPEKIPVADPDLRFVFADQALSGQQTNCFQTQELLSTTAYADGDTAVQTETGSEHTSLAFKGKKPESMTLISAVQHYGQQAQKIAQLLDFDLIHAHDWLTYPAGIAAQKVSQKPLVTHIHATEHDRTAGQGKNQIVYGIEKNGFQHADHVISVSQYTKGILTDKYNIKEEKITPAHNGITETTPERLPPVLKRWKERGNKIVLFLGRQTIQKGPDHFLQAAKLLSEKRDDVMFIMAGSGDMQEDLIELSAELGIGNRVLFPGFVRGEKTDRLYQSADLYVLSSISEPFGITPLESLLNKTPALISKQSGVSEVVDNALKVDFWETRRMADKMAAALRFPRMAEMLAQKGHEEVKQINWSDTAETCLDCYNKVTP
jgi:glycosyltransferase involved in cell wall biosynthesis